MNSRPALETDQPYELKNAPLRPRQRRDLLERDTTYSIESENGEVILAYERGQQQVWWGFRSVEDMRTDFPQMWPEVLKQVDRDHVDYITMDIAGLPTRTWLDPLLQDADFAFFAEWMDMANPDIASAEVPEFPEGVRMRKADEDDLQRFYAIWTEAYGEYGDGPATFDWLFSGWLPQSEYRLRAGPTFERYPDDARNGALGMAYEIWVPVATRARKKA